MTGLCHDVALVLPGGRRGGRESGTQRGTAELFGGKAGVADMALYGQCGATHR